MLKRASILIGMGAGLLWGFALLWAGVRFVPAPGADLLTLLTYAFFAPGLVLILMIGRLAQRRFFDSGIIDGQPLAAGSGAEIDQRVLTNTVEQLLLALCIWPAMALALPAESRGALVALGLGFAATRLLFWGGYHWWAPLRGFGFAAGFYPTIVAAIWTVLLWLS